jgi:hypothetical protein
MTETEWEPTITSQEDIRYWTFRGGSIVFPPATTPRQLLIEYRAILPPITANGDPISFDRAKNFLAFRTAALCAEFVGGVLISGRADSLNNQASIQLTELMAVYVKNTQGIRVRRKSYRIGYRNRQYPLLTT